MIRYIALLILLAGVSCESTSPLSISDNKSFPFDRTKAIRVQKYIDTYYDTIEKYYNENDVKRFKVSTLKLAIFTSQIPVYYLDSYHDRLIERININGIEPYLTYFLDYSSRIGKFYNHHSDSRISSLQNIITKENSRREVQRNSGHLAFIYEDGNIKSISENYAFQLSALALSSVGREVVRHSINKQKDLTKFLFYHGLCNNCNEIKSTVSEKIKKNDFKVIPKFTLDATLINQTPICAIFDNSIELDGDFSETLRNLMCNAFGESNDDSIPAGSVNIGSSQCFEKWKDEHGDSGYKEISELTTRIEDAIQCEHRVSLSPLGQLSVGWNIASAGTKGAVDLAQLIRNENQYSEDEKQVIINGTKYTTDNEHCIIGVCEGNVDSHFGSNVGYYHYSGGVTIWELHSTPEDKEMVYIELSSAYLSGGILGHIHITENEDGTNSGGGKIKVNGNEMIVGYDDENGYSFSLTSEDGETDVVTTCDSSLENCTFKCYGDCTEPDDYFELKDDQEDVIKKLKKANDKSKIITNPNEDPCFESNDLALQGEDVWGPIINPGPQGDLPDILGLNELLNCIESQQTTVYCMSQLMCIDEPCGCSPELVESFFGSGCQQAIICPEGTSSLPPPNCGCSIQGFDGDNPFMGLYPGYVRLSE